MLYALLLHIPNYAWISTETLGISGEITVKLPTTCCIYTSPEGIKFACDDVTQIAFDTFFYYIKIRDRAGHESNEIKTESIRLKCQ